MGSNVELVGKIYEAFGRGDIPFVLEQIAEDAGWESWNDWTPHRAGVPWLASGEGKAGALAFFQVIGVWQIQDIKIHSLMDGGTSVAAEVEIAAVLPNGARIHDEEMHLWTFNDAGKVTRLRHYVDTAKHIAAAQVGESAAAAS